MLNILSIETFTFNFVYPPYYISFVLHGFNIKQLNESKRRQKLKSLDLETCLIYTASRT
jgi:hypothetical protein